MSLAEALARSTRSADEADGRDYGWHVGTVTDVNDPQGLGRVKARIAAMDSNAAADWLVPGWPGSMEAKPRTGEAVLVAFLDGNPNKGLYLWTTRTNQSARPTEPAMLGLAFVALYNDLVAKFNTLKGKYNQAQADITALYTLVNTTGLAVVGALAKANPAIVATSSTDADADAGNGLASDKSTPAASASSAVVLSGEIKVR